MTSCSLFQPSVCMYDCGYIVQRYPCMGSKDPKTTGQREEKDMYLGVIL